MGTSDEGSKGRKCKPKPDRLEYLDQLVVEFQTTKSRDAREQVLANLANFAYDPSNYNYFRRLNVLDLFLDNLSDQEENLIKYSIGGLCNLCLDPLNKKYINENGLKQIIKLLEHENEDVMLSALTTLLFLVGPDSKAEITSSAVINSVVRLSKKENVRLNHLVAIFLSDCCTEEQVKQSLLQSDALEIPMPESK